MLEKCELESPFETFGNRAGRELFWSKKSKRETRSRGAGGKTPVFGMLKRNGKRCILKLLEVVKYQI